MLGLAAGEAQTTSDVTLLLRSHEQHGGSYSWRMLRQQEVTNAGAEIATAGMDTSRWQAAVVPGTVLGSLVHDGVYPEPYFGLNNAHEQKLIPDISEAGREFYTYWFRTEFVLPKAFEGREVWLQFDGINYRAEVWLNGRKMGELAGMFQRGVFDVTGAVRLSGTNALAVLVRPVDAVGGFRQKDETIRVAGENRNGGDGNIGRNTTMLMTVGWDFTFTDGIRDRNTGIWRDVKLFATGPVALRNPYVKSKLPLPALAPANEEILVDVVNATQHLQEGEVRANVPEAHVSIHKSVSLAPLETRTVAFAPSEFSSLIFTKPKLWWPFNKGEQFLYQLNVEFVQNGKVSDRIRSRFGVREITSDQNTPDRSRQFLVNGRRFFVHGANWIPEAMCRGSDERTDAELRYTRQSGVNFLRLWAGGVAESDRFFADCDELGIPVWLEFWETGDTRLPDDRQLYRANVADTILRIRNHASIAYYVAANERPGAPNDKVDPALIVPMKDIVAELDSQHGWQQSSETDGVHDGSPYWSVNPMWYYENTASERGSRIDGFCPEYGCPILPTSDCLREMMEAKDLWPPNKTIWNYLDGGGFHRMTTDYDRAVRQYGSSASLEEYAMKAQAFGGLAYRAIWECWNANKFDYGDRFSTGLLFWYHNSPNPQVCGRMWDWSLEPTAALYFTQNALEPLHAQFDFLKNTVAVNNELPRAFDGRLTARVLDFQLKEVARQVRSVHVPAEGLLMNAAAIDFPAGITPVHFIKLELADSRGRPVSDTFYWRSDKPYERGRTWTGPQFEGFEDLTRLPRVRLATEVKWRFEKRENICVVSVRNPSPSLAFMVWLRLQQASDSKPVRPAFYDNNFFSLLPGESRNINIHFAGNTPYATQLTLDGWNMERQIFKASENRK
jgi:exo-1,4-beta-D-glucosaminidase